MSSAVAYVSAPSPVDEKPQLAQDVRSTSAVEAFKMDDEDIHVFFGAQADHLMDSAELRNFGNLSAFAPLPELHQWYDRRGNLVLGVNLTKLPDDDDALPRLEDMVLSDSEEEEEEDRYAPKSTPKRSTRLHSVSDQQLQESSDSSTPPSSTRPLPTFEHPQPIPDWLRTSFDLSLDFPLPSSPLPQQFEAYRTPPTSHPPLTATPPLTEVRLLDEILIAEGGEQLEKLRKGLMEKVLMEARAGGFEVLEDAQVGNNSADGDTTKPRLRVAVVRRTSGAPAGIVIRQHLKNLAAEWAALPGAPIPNEYAQAVHSAISYAHAEIERADYHGSLTLATIFGLVPGQYDLAPFFLVSTPATQDPALWRNHIADRVPIAVQGPSLRAHIANFHIIIVMGEGGGVLELAHWLEILWRMRPRSRLIFTRRANPANVLDFTREDLFNAVVDRIANINWNVGGDIAQILDGWEKQWVSRSFQSIAVTSLQQENRRVSSEHPLRDFLR